MNNNSLPLVSVGLPVRNGEKTLSKALNSIFNQTYNNIEIIISNNVSTDATDSIISDFVDRYNNIKYIKQTVELSGIKHFQSVFVQ